MTARQAQTSDHEARHAAAAILLGADVLLVERRSVGGQHGQVLFRAPDSLTKQIVLLVPLVHAHDSPTFDLDSHGADVVQAMKLGPIDLATAVARECVEDPEYRRLAQRIAGRLMTQPTLGREDIGRMME